MQQQQQQQQLFALQHRKDFCFLCNAHSIPYLYTTRDKAEKSLSRNFRGVTLFFEVVEIVIQRRMP